MVDAIWQSQEEAKQKWKQKWIDQQAVVSHGSGFQQ
tara:strand:+ start:1315 stop:1422 length:108 start_codon:yes stop_codon:yes gene_type:complete